ncbi:MAG: ATP-binding protein [Verrucomicrobiota bacterium]
MARVQPHPDLDDRRLGADAHLDCRQRHWYSPCHHQRIFGVFERLHSNGLSGTGIGLAIVAKGVNRLGGTVGVESTEGQGGRFWIELPKPSASEQRPHNPTR